MLNSELTTLCLAYYMGKANKLNNRLLAKKIRKTAKRLFNRCDSDELNDLLFTINVEQNDKHVINIMRLTTNGLMKQGLIG